MFYRPIPSTDLYFLNSCRDLTGWGKPVTRLGSNSFRCGDRYLIIRSERSAIVQKILNTPRARIILVIDDDIRAASSDATLPPAYQRRLEDAATGDTGALMARADLVLAPSQQLMDRLADCRKVERIDPYWGKQCTTGSHFDSMGEGTVSLVHMGTASHQAAMNFLGPVLAQVLEALPAVTFSYFARRSMLSELDKHTRVNKLPLMPWRKYARTLGERQFHLALYPILDTPFNRARSCYKITEHALSGCAGLTRLPCIQSG